MLPVARLAPTPNVAAAMRQSAWCRVVPRLANSLRQVPARSPSDTPSGASRRPRKSLRTAGSSSGRIPRQISSTEMAHTQGSTPALRRLANRDAAGLPRSASIRTVESNNKRDTVAQPARRESPRRCCLTHPPGSASQSWLWPESLPSALSMSSHLRSSSRPRRISSATKALRLRGPARRSNSATSSSSNAMCKRMCLT